MTRAATDMTLESKRCKQSLGCLFEVSSKTTFNSHLHSKQEKRTLLLRRRNHPKNSFYHEKSQGCGRFCKRDVIIEYDGHEWVDDHHHHHHHDSLSIDWFFLSRIGSWDAFWSLTAKVERDQRRDTEINNNRRIKWTSKESSQGSSFIVLSFPDEHLLWTTGCFEEVEDFLLLRLHEHLLLDHPHQMRLTVCRLTVTLRVFFFSIQVHPLNYFPWRPLLCFLASVTSQTFCRPNRQELVNSHCRSLLRIRPPFSWTPTWHSSYNHSAVFYSKTSLTSSNSTGSVLRLFANGSY